MNLTQPLHQVLQVHCRSLIAGDPRPLSAAGQVLQVDLRAPLRAGQPRHVNRSLLP